MLGEYDVGKTVSEEHESTLSLSQPVDLEKKIIQKLRAAERYIGYSRFTPKLKFWKIDDFHNLESD